MLATTTSNVPASVRPGAWRRRNAVRRVRARRRSRRHRRRCMTCTDFAAAIAKFRSIHSRARSHRAEAPREPFRHKRRRMRPSRMRGRVRLHVDCRRVRRSHRRHDQRRSWICNGANCDCVARTNPDPQRRPSRAGGGHPRSAPALASACAASVDAGKSAVSRAIGQCASITMPGSPYTGISAAVPASESAMSTDNAPASRSASLHASAAPASASKRSAV